MHNPAYLFRLFHTSARECKRHPVTSPGVPIVLWILFVLGIMLTILYLWTDKGAPSSSLVLAGFWVHLPSQAPENGDASADTRHAASELQATLNRARKGEDEKYQITFVPTDDERDQWRHREEMRFRDGIYTNVPWISGLSLYFGTFDCDLLDGRDKYGPVYDRVNETIVAHYPHLSVKQPGLIAYTPTEEHGINDRQVTIKPGRYLEQFLAEIFSKATRDKITAHVKGCTGALQIARTPEDIVSVYLHGPRSCMAHSLTSGNFSSHPHHPTAVYGNSDLGVAYLGEISDPRARCLVWPDEMKYGRLYGDDALRVQLEMHGYTYSEYFHGARVRVLRSANGRYVMPYVDQAEGCTLDGASFVLSEDSEEYGCRETNGLVTCEDEGNECRHCDRQVDEDGDICDACSEIYASCERCGEDVHEDNQYSVQNGSGDYLVYCRACNNRCAHCAAPQCSARIPHDSDDTLCYECEGNFDECTECSDLYDNREHSACPDCTPETDNDDGDEDEDEDAPEATIAIGLAGDTYDRAVHAALTEDGYTAVPVVSPFVRVRLHTDNPLCVQTQYSRGLFAVHASLTSPRVFAITHTPSGYAVSHRESLADAMLVCRLLAVSESRIDWTSSSADDLSACVYTGCYGRAIVRTASEDLRAFDGETIEYIAARLLVTLPPAPAPLARMEVI